MCLGFRSAEGVRSVVVVVGGPGPVVVSVGLGLGVPINDSGAVTGGEEEGKLICGGWVVYHKLSLMVRVGSTRLTI